MNVESFREYCISKKGVTEELPFGPDTLVFKVMNKMFALSAIDNFSGFNAKCDPERAVELRGAYSAIRPGFHMNKKHWNTIDCDGSLPDSLIYELIDHSYELVIESLPKKVRTELAEMQD
ncbi:MAG TPA: MmcQ-like protein [Flavobacteriales bacterium]|jgi:predicted DNA-binding protein (MmcQ/YjbR family)|nr:MmcQ/YjbR family DNA-binding protein [Flavobacteriales bacterium]HAW19544.1 MmcQ-like protein [Flavobacteriales bacterium]